MKKKKKNRNFGGVIVVLCLILVACLAVLIGIAHRNQNVDTPPTQTTTEQQSAADAAATTAEPSTEKPVTEESTTDESTEYTDNNQTVYAKEDVNIRKEPSSESEKKGLLKAGESIKRVAVGDNGWSKVEYKDEICYIHSSYLVIERPTTEEATTVDRTVIDPTEGDWKLVVVNAYREYDKSYEPKLKKVLPDTGYNIYMDHRVADSFTEMYYAAKEDGITLTPISGYRSYERQEMNHKNRIALWQSKGYSYNEAVAKTSEVILPPGTSEHNLGLAMDICSLDYDFNETKEYKWLETNAHKYGFILRYTEEWKSKTGIVGEPWHWRYVGKENAKKIKDSGLCLEEYVGVN